MLAKYSIESKGKESENNGTNHKDNSTVAENNVNITSQDDSSTSGVL